MTKARQPQSAEEALNQSILALRPDPVTGLSKWERAADLTGMAVRSLYSACDPDPPNGRPVPIKLEWVELLDRVNVAEGGEAVNIPALEARHAAAVAGLDLPPPSPELRLERAVLEIRAAAGEYRDGHGDPWETHRHIASVHDRIAEMLKTWNARERGRRAADPPRLVERDRGEEAG